jgi:hypothetical protein
MNHHLDVCLELCKKSIPETGKDPGYFFFETQDGFQFRSIEGLINEGIDRFSNTGYEDTHTYNYFGALDANLDNDENNFKVLLPPVVKRDQNQLNALKAWFIQRSCQHNEHTYRRVSGKGREFIKFI